MCLLVNKRTATGVVLRLCFSLHRCTTGSQVPLFGIGGKQNRMTRIQPTQIHAATAPHFFYITQRVYIILLEEHSDDVSPFSFSRLAAHIHFLLYIECPNQLSINYCAKLECQQVKATTYARPPQPELSTVILALNSLSIWCCKNVNCKVSVCGFTYVHSMATSCIRFSVCVRVFWDSLT